MKVYTRTGDSGTTMLFAGGRVPKHHIRVDAYGTVDELNSVLGVVRASGPQPQTEEWLVRIQNELFRLGADLATPSGAKSRHVIRVQEDAVSWLEQAIDQMTEEMPPLKNFVLPGGSLVGAHLHVARTVCRRAERLTSLLATQEELGAQTLPYLNRLSDFLFTLARWENFKAGIPEERWGVWPD